MKKEQDQEMCSTCGKLFTLGDLQAWSMIILEEESSCSRECLLASKEEPPEKQ